jgi:ribosomal protein L32E
VICSGGLKSYPIFRHRPLEKHDLPNNIPRFARHPHNVMRAVAAGFSEPIHFKEMSPHQRVSWPMGRALRQRFGRRSMPTYVPPPGLKLIDDRKLPRFQRRAIKRAKKLDREFFRQNPLRLTRVRRTVDGETGTAVVQGKWSIAIVRQVHPGAYHTLLGFTDINLVEIASSESAAAQLYDLLLEIEQRGWAAKLKQQALGELLAFAPIAGRA